MTAVACFKCHCSEQRHQRDTWQPAVNTSPDHVPICKLLLRIDILLLRKANSWTWTIYVFDLNKTASTLHTLMMACTMVTTTMAHLHIVGIIYSGFTLPTPPPPRLSSQHLSPKSGHQQDCCHWKLLPGMFYLKWKKINWTEQVTVINENVGTPKLDLHYMARNIFVFEYLSNSNDNIDNICFASLTL